MFPEQRMRRLRRTQNIRNMVQEVQLNMNDYIYPIFVVEGHDIKNPIKSMPGIYQFSLDHLLEEVQRAVDAGVISIMLFGIPAQKDECGSEAYNDDGIIQQAIRLVRKHYPDLVISTDVCMCEYTSHGHCGLIKGDTVDNDSTLALLAKIAVSHAKAGADILAPSDMMDGRVEAIREALDESGYNDVIIMVHSVKYASGFYGPFRDAAESAPHFGDRKSYQMDPASGTRQALQEVELDLEEGADMVIIKPSLAYLDLISKTYENTLVPVVAYNVSAEYSMVKAAAQNGWIDEKTIVLEIMNAFKRAGAKMVITYHAIDLGNWLKENR